MTNISLFESFIPEIVSYFLSKLNFSRTIQQLVDKVVVVFCLFVASAKNMEKQIRGKAKIGCRFFSHRHANSNEYPDLTCRLLKHFYPTTLIEMAVSSLPSQLPAASSDRDVSTDFPDDKYLTTAVFFVDAFKKRKRQFSRDETE